ncbi:MULTISPECIES: Fur-regulated basic protein FbpA [Bacillus]|uniref:Fur-regulated basic protein FbpA n=1 Tax=Bacillus TaxID=1386 RepID=UPI000C79391E|nr:MULTISPECIES: Fur-regulated basic protein FbpA [Bacillus]PLR83379.1 Fur-regulated basic protein FbpA [Bacillus sp. V33-4]RSK47453.1 Fur-regulated basic protein FbpA [Bacillus canaveralius]
MPFLREAVEKKRREFISILMNAGVLRNSDKEYQKWTFTELKTECKRLQINNKKND